MLYGFTYMLCVHTRTHALRLYLHALLMLYCCLYLSEYVAELYPVVIQLLQR
jgi:hypothetical protein